MNRAGNQYRGMDQGSCRNRSENLFAVGRSRKGRGTLCRRVGEFPDDEDRSLRAESVVGDEQRSPISSLRLLKEQLGRLTRAMQKIEEQIECSKQEE